MSNRKLLSYENAYVKQPPPYKKTDFRLQLWKNERKELRLKVRRENFHVARGDNLTNAPVSVDTSKARSNSDVIRLCLRELGWNEKETASKKKSHIYWHSLSYEDNDNIPPAARVNKFPGMINCLRKIALSRTLDVMARLYPTSYDFHPQSWILPTQWSTWFEDFERKPSIYIVKPNDGTHGNGIYLLTDPRRYDVGGNRKHIVQEYLSKPLLLEGKKFDLRIYVVISNLEPLTVHVCREGLVRLCTEDYRSPNTSNLHKVHMHLTNYSLNKSSPSYVHTDDVNDGNKRTVTALLKTLRSCGYDVTMLWSNIVDVAAKTAISIAPQLQVELRAITAPRPQPFQILGFDLLVLNNLSVSLLEVNACPSLRIDYDQSIAPGITETIHSAVDEEIKKPLVQETLKLVAPPHANVDCDDTILEEVLPLRADEYRCYCIIDRIVKIFTASLGVRATLRMNHTAFRNFARRCKLTGITGGVSSASIDLLYLEVQRRSEHVEDSGKSGLCYQGFLDAFLSLAKIKYSSADNLLESVLSLIGYCETQLNNHSLPPAYKPLLKKRTSSGNTFTKQLVDDH
ncbi:DgyrCDS6709 [Dimorphilus gyrociliatus]|uniref:DgyrCDS6709 n=1 Tax=Dimorphilus gyrociliatus TaxID=2664684 RepID=A0A7I8VQE8_9ANNE|nr:DgyrCDS6709 [Dimorphilus gyrociliatus]